jgi:hypothetical protein
VFALLGKERQQSEWSKQDGCSDRGTDATTRFLADTLGGFSVALVEAAGFVKGTITSRFDSTKRRGL